MSSIVPTKPAPTPGVNRWAKRMTVVRRVPSSRTSRAWISTSSPSSAAATCSMTPSRSSSWIVSIQPVPQELLGPQADQAAEGVVDVGEAHALFGEQGRDRRPLGQGGEPPLMGVRGGPQRALLLVGGRQDANGPHA